MRILELEVTNVRGIRSLHLKPSAKNLLIWGPNGSGKSAVVDALDFLLTGKVSRLTGKGTGSLTLSKYGPHIDGKPQESVVRALVQVDGLPGPVELKRCMASPGVLEFPSEAAAQLEPLLTIARRGQHVLTRREILRYITAEARTRAEQIQELLNLSDVEESRRTLVRVKGDADRERKAAERSVEQARAAVNMTVQARKFSEATVLDAVNSHRAVLGGSSITRLFPSEVKNGIAAPKVATEKAGVNVTLFERDVEALCNVLDERSHQVRSATDAQLRDLVITIRADRQAQRALARVKLRQLGIGLIEDTGECPLCETAWEPGELRKYLEDQIALARATETQQSTVVQLTGPIASPMNTAIAALEKIAAAAGVVGLTDEKAQLQQWLGELRGLSQLLADVLAKYPDPAYPPERVASLCSPPDAEAMLTRVKETVQQRYPQSTPEQNAWDTLTRLEENLKALNNAEIEHETVALFSKRATALHDAFLRNRDLILKELYDTICERFTGLYRALHETDERGFVAKLEPHEAGLNLEVDFHGRGTHPPHALHSEGHQDSMGICLYLALAERLSQGIVNVVILDDVVMSVDGGHRRELCRVLATAFPGRQFLITTHDRTWAHQLRSEGVVGRDGNVELFGWTIETGPRVNQEVDVWSRIAQDLARGDVPAAAGRLRRASEEYFATVCNNLQVRVKYRLSGQWELGDLLIPAMDQLRDLLRNAKKAATSWDDTEAVARLAELETVRSQVWGRTLAEQWAVNTNVHYNSWINFTDADFRPVVEAFADLFTLFSCSTCGSVLRLALLDRKPASVRCNCGGVNWNLIGKV